MSKSNKETPLMVQYNGFKKKYPDAILLFRVGDFYETFGTDAHTIAKILGITLTKRGNGSQSETALAGFPHHAINTYLPKIVAAGHRVAICDQLEDPKMAAGKIVKRGVTEMVTPGVTLNDEILTAKSNNFLSALHVDKHVFGIAFVDISTGEFMTSSGDEGHIKKLLQLFQPSEVLLDKKHKTKFLETFSSQYNAYYLNDWVFKIDYAQETLNTHFGTKSLKGFGVMDMPEGVIASGAALHYLHETQHEKLAHITKLFRIASDKYVWLDNFTIQNLEITRKSSADATCLLDVVDQTVSPMGARMLQRYLLLPLKDLKKIQRRHEMVAYFLSQTEVHQQIITHLKQVGDLERLISKVATARINPREVVQLKNALSLLGPIQKLMQTSGNSTLQSMEAQFLACDKLIDKISQTLEETAPVVTQKGGVIKQGFCQELDETRDLLNSSKQFLEAILQKEIEQTGISSLKIGSNNVFGFYLEVRHSHRDKVPESWIRKQTLTNAERYITPELKEYEGKILGAEERILGLEQQLFADLIDWIVPYTAAVQTNANLLAHLDCLCSFATLARDNNYQRPEMNEGFDLEIKEGRHPVIETCLPPGTPYIPNDLSLKRNSQQILMITGPNMAGKSAILRQTALIVLLAQAGSFVPVSQAKIGIVDKIFTRVGASDNMSLGESTFMVEMSETANILNNLSDRSLILLDEIGRGTSTYDGISIAWSIASYLHEHPYQIRTLFATHYHELNEMTQTFERIKNYHVAVKELPDKVLFLYKLTEGGSEHSFGIHVAKMAGMPQPIVDKAKEILSGFEAHEGLNTRTTIKPKEKPIQLKLFSVEDEAVKKIKTTFKKLDIDNLTPMDALLKLRELKEEFTKH